jgi:hypothetical protein
MGKHGVVLATAWVALSFCGIAWADDPDGSPAVETESAFSLGGQQFAKAALAEKMKHGSRMKAEAKVGSGFFVSLYGGYDFANLGALATDADNLLNFAKNLGDTSSIGVGGSGILAGCEAGYALDASNSLSLSLENTWTGESGINITASTVGDAGYFEKLDPSLLAASLNYQLVVLQGKDNKVSLSLGAGYYHASVHFESNILDKTTFISGDFGQDGIGGTLGVSDELALGGSLALGVSARFRVADFNKLTSNSVSINGFAQTSNGPFVLVSDKVDRTYTVIVPAQTNYTLPSGNVDTDLDYTGFTGNILLTLYL